jgi:hypothetical protein
LNVAFRNAVASFGSAIHSASGAKFAAMPSSTPCVQPRGSDAPSQRNTSRMTGAWADRKETAAIFPAALKLQKTGRAR